MSDVRLQDSHDKRSQLQAAVFVIGILAVGIIVGIALVAAIWPSPVPCLPGAKDCVTLPNWGLDTITKLTSMKDLLSDMLLILVGGGGGILFGRGAFDAYVGKKGPTP